MQSLEEGKPNQYAPQDLLKDVSVGRDATIGNITQQNIQTQIVLAQSNSTPLSAQFPKPSSFDLAQLVEECLLALDGKQGLIGLIVPCDEDGFRQYFCERLKDELGRRQIQIRPPLTLNPFKSVADAISDIKRYKGLLQIGDVICPIGIQIFDSGSDILNTFWQGVSTEFGGSFQHRLILIFLGNQNCVFPKGPLVFTCPVFSKIHAHQWVVKVTSLLGWADEVTIRWKQRIVLECLLEEAGKECLDMRRVYEHLQDTLQLLQQNLSEETFLSYISQGS